MNSRSLSTYEESQAIKARTDGREAKASSNRGGSRIITNKYKAGTFHAYCWNAGYNADTRSILELHADWSKPPEAAPDPQSAAGNL